MEIGPQELGDKIAMAVSDVQADMVDGQDLHVF